MIWKADASYLTKGPKTTVFDDICLTIDVINTDVDGRFESLCSNKHA